jgi:hypothetical protein
MISMLWRHGARLARKNIFKAPDIDPTLTDPQDIIGNGARMHYVLGKQISSIEYPALFPQPGGSKEMKTESYLIYSTQTQRT